MPPLYTAPEIIGVAFVCALFLVIGFILGIWFVSPMGEEVRATLWVSQIEGEDMDPTTLHMGSLGCLVHFQAENAEGQALPPASTPAWSVDDPTKVEIDPTGDGLTCQVKPLAVTSAPVTVSATDGKAGSSVQFVVFDNVETQAVLTVDQEQFPPAPEKPAEQPAASAPAAPSA